jgi:small subunit ribosomal protein S9
MRKVRQSKELKKTNEEATSLTIQNALINTDQQNVTNTASATPVTFNRIKTYFGFGKRKRARAYVRLQPGEGKIIVNGLPIHRYFPTPFIRSKVTLPVRLAGLSSQLDIKIFTFGGGVQGQLDACIPAVARAILQMDERHRRVFAESKIII